MKLRSILQSGSESVQIPEVAEGLEPAKIPEVAEGLQVAKAPEQVLESAASAEQVQVNPTQASS
jgi:hypothetical protein